MNKGHLEKRIGSHSKKHGKQCIHSCWTPVEACESLIVGPYHIAPVIHLNLARLNYLVPMIIIILIILTTIDTNNNKNENDDIYI